MNLKELAKQETRIHLEDEQDKKEFLEWYINNGGSNMSDRFNIETIKYPYVYLGFRDSILYWWTTVTIPLYSFPWKIVTNKTELLSEIKWDGKSYLDSKHIRINKVDNKHFVLNYCKKEIVSNTADVTIKFGGAKHTHTIDDVNKVLALYGYKIIIEEPKYKLKLNGVYTEDEVRKLEEIGIKFEKEKI